MRDAVKGFGQILTRLELAGSIAADSSNFLEELQHAPHRGANGLQADRVNERVALASQAVDAERTPHQAADRVIRGQLVLLGKDLDSFDLGQDTQNKPPGQPSGDDRLKEGPEVTPPRLLSSR